ncbi:MAG: aminotransferase class I/II-fold pyridoxal phosphate-dependent enzyme [Planctomycetes bacterium]|nr:aminotransferase class I/II-fold pyridoxal phosphate-dependent enzyme [Planctomycetota bacterium]
MSKYSDFRSDTVTKPTARMFDAMQSARLGDDAHGDDPTVQELERHFQNLFGKESALFFPSGTMANQAAVAAHTVPGEEIIVDDSSHIFMFEGGGLSRIAGVQTRTLNTRNGQFDFGRLAHAVRPVSVHMPRTGLICTEQSHLFSGGSILPIDYLQELHAFGLNRAIPVHLDGARLFNVQVETELPFSEYGDVCDSLMISLSKGLSCPIGSILLGDGAFIERARRVRKWMGGGMHQAGIIAACGLVAIDQMPARIATDNAMCRQLGGMVLGLQGARMAQETIDTNILFLEITQPNLDAPMVEAALADHGVLALALGDRLLRFVTHRHLNDSDVERAGSALNQILNA